MKWVRREILKEIFRFVIKIRWTADTVVRILFTLLNYFSWIEKPFWLIHFFFYFKLPSRTCQVVLIFETPSPKEIELSFWNPFSTFRIIIRQISLNVPILSYYNEIWGDKDIGSTNDLSMTLCIFGLI